jgi:hypothetical protein
LYFGGAVGSVVYKIKDEFRCIVEQCRLSKLVMDIQFIEKLALCNAGTQRFERG